MSQSEEGLRNMLLALSSNVEENGMAMNTVKTQCMIFNKTGKYIRRTYPMNNGTITTTNSYKYLGFIFAPSGELCSMHRTERSTRQSAESISQAIKQDGSLF